MYYRNNEEIQLFYQKHKADYYISSLWQKVALNTITPYFVAFPNYEIFSL
jgi:hypothetical protein